MFVRWRIFLEFCSCDSYNKYFFSFLFNRFLGSCLVSVQHNCWKSSSSASSDRCWLNANDYSFAGKGRLPDPEGSYFYCSNFLFVIFTGAKFVLTICNSGSSMGSFECDNQWTCGTGGIHGFTRCYTTVLCPTFYTWLTNCAGCPGWPEQYSQDGWAPLGINLYNDWRVRRWIFVLYGEVELSSEDQ